MLFYLHSTDPSSFGTVRFSTSPSIEPGQLYFRIINLSTIASFLITTSKDFFVLQVGSDTITVNFTDRGEYDLPFDLRKLLPADFNISLNPQGTLTLSHATQEFTILEATHRAQLLLGLYYTKLPLKSTNHEFIMPSVPFVCYGNNLFLQPRVSAVVGRSSDNGLSYTSLCYCVNEIFVPGIAIISHRLGSFTKIAYSDITKMEFTLVDFLGKPVILKSPLFITMELVSEHELGAQSISSNQI